MSNLINMQPLPLPGLILIRRIPVSDKRGFLQRMYCQDEFEKIGLTEPIMQINHTLTRFTGTIRGMHFQYPPYSETKIVTCLNGCVFDVVIDLRKGSPTFLKWHGEILSPERNNSLLIPKGFAHGFQTLTDDCQLIYFHTTSYQKSSEGGISPMDTRVGIHWPLKITELSDRDRNHPQLMNDFAGITNEM